MTEHDGTPQPPLTLNETGKTNYEIPINKPTNPNHPTEIPPQSTKKNKNTTRRTHKNETKIRERERERLGIRQLRTEH